MPNLFFHYYFVNNGTKLIKRSKNFAPTGQAVRFVNFGLFFMNNIVIEIFNQKKSEATWFARILKCRVVQVNSPSV